MTKTFEVSASEFRFASEFGGITYPLLLIRFAPNPEVSGHRNYFEWQIDVEGDVAAYLEGSDGARGESCAMMGKSDFVVPFYLRDDERKELVDETPISAMLPGAVGIMTEDLLPYATPLMYDLISAFAARGVKVVAAGQYPGNGFGPSHFLRDGVIYKKRR